MDLVSNLIHSTMSVELLVVELPIPQMITLLLNIQGKLS